MKFVTFNIRYDTPSDGINAFSHRSGMILGKIEAERPDVIGFQECRPHVFDFLRRHLVDYTVVGCGRGADYEDEHNPVAFRTEQYELIGLQTSWLSPTPDIPGSRHAEQSPCPRIMTVATLRIIGTPRAFDVYNIHLDHEFERARILGANQLIEAMRAKLARREMPLVLLGDFNAYPTDAPVRALLGDAQLALTDHTRAIPHSFHAYGAQTNPRIDYIMSRGFRALGDAHIWDDCQNGVYLSDHYPIAINLEME
ncbi:MAG: endonuclease/exonuclease/phosphatase family protein [Christensenellales bacterium]|jgi:endonuclease/exonuclease/phosphatase family metal-dependent hydrolase